MAITLATHKHDTDYLQLTGGTVTGSIIINQDLSAGTITETSARKYKENIKPLENVLETINKLQGVSYTWKESKKEDIGFIADEVNEILPQLVKKDSETNEIEGMNYSKIVSLLIEGMKTQQKEIEILKEEVENLKKG